MRNWYKTVRGQVNRILSSQRYGSKKRGHPRPLYSVHELNEWLMEHGFMDLYSAWVASDYDMLMTPSTDRLDDSKGYSFDNLRLVTWRENKERAYEDRKNNILVTSQNKKVNQLTKDGVYIRSFDSIESAACAVSGDATNILKVCQKRPSHLTSKRFRWEFAQT